MLFSPITFIEHGINTYIYVLYTLIARVYLAYGSVELYTSSLFVLSPLFNFAETCKNAGKRPFSRNLYFILRKGKMKSSNVETIKIKISP